MPRSRPGQQRRAARRGGSSTTQVIHTSVARAVEGRCNADVTKLASERCTACRPDSPAVGEAELPALLREIPSWRVAERDGVPRLERVFTFPDFAAALAFTNPVGAAAQAGGPRPPPLTEWGRV